MSTMDHDHSTTPSPLAPGECVEVFAACSLAPMTGPDALCDHIRANGTGFMPLTHRFSRRRFRGVFTFPESVLLVSHTGCGCGFGLGLPDADDEQIIEAFLAAAPEKQRAAQRDVDALIVWTTHQLATANAVELWITTNNPRRAKPTRAFETTAATIAEDARIFRVGDLIRVTHGAYAHA